MAKMVLRHLVYGSSYWFAGCVTAFSLSSMRLVDTDEARNWTKQNDNTLAFPIGRATTITITSLTLWREEEKRRRGNRS